MNEARRPLPQRMSEGCFDPESTRRCTSFPASRLPESQASAERIALFHYVTRSKQDFETKQRRGGGNNPVGKNNAFFEHYQMCDINSILPVIAAMGSKIVSPPGCVE